MSELFDRVIEVDVKEDREVTINVRVLKTTPFRKGIIPHEHDPKKDVTVLVNGLLASILRAENLGACEKGEAMKYVMKQLNEGYTDATLKVESL